MRKDLAQLYVVIFDNEVIAFESNLSAFHKIILSLDPTAKGYKYYQNNLHLNSVLPLTNIKTKKTYFLQKLI